jgi:hypothetical protein
MRIRKWGDTCPGGVRSTEIESKITLVSLVGDDWRCWRLELADDDKTFKVAGEGD